MKNFKLIHLIAALVIGALLGSAYFLLPSEAGQGRLVKINRQTAATDQRATRSASNPTPKVICLEPIDENTKDLLKNVREIVKEGNSNFAAGTIEKPNMGPAYDDTVLKRGATTLNSKAQTEVTEFNVNSIPDIWTKPYPTLQFNETFTFHINKAIPLGKEPVPSSYARHIIVQDTPNDSTKIVSYSTEYCNGPEYCNDHYSPTTTSELTIDYKNQTAQLSEGSYDENGVGGGVIDVEYQEAEKLYNCAKAEIQESLNKYGKLPNQF